MNTYAFRQVDLEVELAQLLGWCDITLPREFNENCRAMGSQGREFASNSGMAMRSINNTFLPRWCRDWSAAGELIGALDINIDIDLGVVTATISPMHFFRTIIADHPNKHAALRWAITQAAVEYLKGQKNGK